MIVWVGDIEVVVWVLEYCLEVVMNYVGGDLFVVYWVVDKGVYEVFGVV